MIRITFYRPRIFTREFWRQRKQRRTDGFIHEDTYCLEWKIAKFVAPRLKVFRKYQGDESNPDWCRMVDKMVWSMEQIANGDGGPFLHPDELTDEERKIYYKKLQEGLTLFGRNFHSLWW